MSYNIKEEQTQMIIYKGFTIDDYKTSVMVGFGNSIGNMVWKRLDWCLSWVNHNPNGLSWGNSKVDCKQLAFAILHDYVKREYSLPPEKSFSIVSDVYEDFAKDFVEKFAVDWTLYGDKIGEWLESA